MLYMILIGFLFFVLDDHYNVRDVVGCIKVFDFFVIPFIQIYTSAPIRRYIQSQKQKWKPRRDKEPRKQIFQI